MVRKRIILGIILLLVSGSVLAGAMSSRINWIPSELKPPSIAPGESMTVDVVIENTGRRAMKAKHLAVVPEGDVADYVSIDIASSSKHLRKGETITATITITSPESMPLSVKTGALVLKRIKCRMKKEKKTGEEYEVCREKKLHRASPLSVELTFSSIPLPPDPGTSGKVPLFGIDSDGDGVRDDVQRWIVLTYPNSEITRAALRQKAILLQNALMYSDDQMLSIEVARENGRAAECLYYTNPDNAYMLATELRSVVLNTEERSVAYIRYNAQLSGQSFRGRRIFDWKASCAFDVDSMEG